MTRHGPVTQPAAFGLEFLGKEAGIAHLPQQRQDLVRDPPSGHREAVEAAHRGEHVADPVGASPAAVAPAPALDRAGPKVRDEQVQIPGGLDQGPAARDAPGLEHGEVPRVSLGRALSLAPAGAQIEQERVEPLDPVKRVVEHGPVGELSLEGYPERLVSLCCTFTHVVHGTNHH